MKYGYTVEWVCSYEMRYIATAKFVKIRRWPNWIIILNCRVQSLVWSAGTETMERKTTITQHFRTCHKHLWEWFKIEDDFLADQIGAAKNIVQYCISTPNWFLLFNSSMVGERHLDSILMYTLHVYHYNNCTLSITSVVAGTQRHNCWQTAYL